MRLTLVVIICLVAFHQSAIAAVGVATDEEVAPLSDVNGHEQPAAVAPASETKALPEASRGSMLYENHCTSCHESTVYIRARRKASNYEELGDWVSQRADWLNLGWGDAEKHEVMRYLNERYYRFPPVE